MTHSPSTPQYLRLTEHFQKIAHFEHAWRVQRANNDWQGFKPLSDPAQDTQAPQQSIHH
ncbi:protein of unknown function [Shewanella benthica]|uniref:Uncharacterized protein n=1 Tax=Shewanella benthica TaxID=43661 RepID=A0A330M388_9GAMM|nr:hypothetical protein [Shewanella benthica]SQH75500.1 protein of unknown function [Shewanella benthica]